MRRNGETVRWDDLIKVKSFLYCFMVQTLSASRKVLKGPEGPGGAAIGWKTLPCEHVGERIELLSFHSSASSSSAPSFFSWLLFLYRMSCFLCVG